MSGLMSKFTDLDTDVRHGAYVWLLTFACLSGMIVITLTQHGELAQHAVDALSSVLTTVVCTYLGVDTLARSQLLNGIGDRIRNGSSNPPVNTTVPVDPNPTPTTGGAS